MTAPRLRLVACALLLAFGAFIMAPVASSASTMALPASWAVIVLATLAAACVALAVASK